LTATSDLAFDQRMQRIAGTLQEAGYDVLLIGRRTPGSGALSARRFRQRRLSCLFRRGPLFYLEFNIRLFLALLTKPAEVIGSADLDTLPAGWLAARLKGLPVVYDAHEYFPESPELAGRPAKRRLWYAAERFLVPRTDAAYTVSDGIRELFLQRYGKDFRVIRNLPVSVTVPTPDPDRPPYVLYQGALNAGRGLEGLIRAMPAIGPELWLAGEGDLSLALRKLADEVAPDKVRFMGRVDPSELVRITAGALIGFNLLDDMGLSYRHSLANKFFDYIMAGIPQVCIDFEEYRKINARYPVAVLVPDTRPETIARTVSGLLADRSLREQLAANCRAARRELHWEAEIPELLAVYRECCPVPVPVAER